MARSPRKSRSQAPAPVPTGTGVATASSAVAENPTPVVSASVTEALVSTTEGTGSASPPVDPAGGATPATNNPRAVNEGLEPAAGSKPAAGDTPAEPQPRPHLVVRSRLPLGRRRARRSFGPAETTIPLDDLSEADRTAIESDPMLIVRLA